MKYSMMILVVVCIAVLAVLFWHAKRPGEKAAAPGSMPAQQASLESKVEKIVIVNNDGFSSFHSGAFRTKEDLQKFVHQFKGTDVTIVEWCLGTGGIFNFDTKVGNVMGRGIDESILKTVRRGDRLAGETVQRLIAEGSEPLRVVADQGRADGIQIFVSLRPDAFYDATFADFSNGDFWRQNPDKRIVGRVLPGAFIGVGLSYVYPEVRQFFLDIILEAVQRDVAGVNLDFERRPPYFGFEKPLVEGFYAKYGFNPPGENPELWWRYQAQFMTDFVRKVRDELDKAEKSLGHRVALSVKIGGGGGYTGKGKHLQYGLDVETWIKEGLVDMLVLFQNSSPIDVDLSSWQRVTAGTQCKIVCGTDAITKGHDLSPKEDAALARGEKLNLESGSQSTIDYCKQAVSWYTAGADGFHLFNGWGGTDTLHVIGSLAKAKAYLAQHGQ